MLLTDEILPRPAAGRPRRILRRRALFVGRGAADALSGALDGAVFESHVAPDPYAAMLMLTDDPTDWLICVVDAGAFPSAAAAEDYIRILCFERPPVPIVLVNAQGMDDGQADLTLGRADAPEIREVILGLAARGALPPAFQAG